MNALTQEEQMDYRAGRSYLRSTQFTEEWTAAGLNRMFQTCDRLCNIIDRLTSCDAAPQAEGVPGPSEEILALRSALRNMADAYARRVKTNLTADEIAKEPWRCLEYVIAEGLLKKPLKLHFTKEWLRARIENDPDLPCEVGAVERPPDAGESAPGPGPYVEGQSDEWKTENLRPATAKWPPKSDYTPLDTTYPSEPPAPTEAAWLEEWVKAVNDAIVYGKAGTGYSVLDALARVGAIKRPMDREAVAEIVRPFVDAIPTNANTKRWACADAIIAADAKGELS